MILKLLRKIRKRWHAMAWTHSQQWSLQQNLHCSYPSSLWVLSQSQGCKRDDIWSLTWLISMKTLVSLFTSLLSVMVLHVHNAWLLQFKKALTCSWRSYIWAIIWTNGCDLRVAIKYFFFMYTRKRRAVRKKKITTAVSATSIRSVLYPECVEGYFRNFNHLVTNETC